jgi:hypothetical protein
MGALVTTAALGFVALAIAALLTPRFRAIEREYPSIVAALESRGPT